jgi:penicillin-binding protein 2
VPSREWKRQTAGRPWLDGDTLNLSIGQGDMLVTPLQVNVMTAAIYNEGIAYRPYLMKEIRNLRYNDVVERNQGREVLFTTDVSKATFATLKRGMETAVSAGTARGAFSPRYQVLGKTGTAQNVQDTPHAWFTCFAPGNARNPEDVIAVTVICENMGGGGLVAVPIAAAVLRARFDNMSIEEAKRLLAPVRKPVGETRRPAVRQL